jgi:hypothetical protein
MLDNGEVPVLQAAIVKDLGTNLEQEICEVVRLVAGGELHVGVNERLLQSLTQALLRAPSCTIRGGTREVLRGVIARGIGLR